MNDKNYIPFDPNRIPFETFHPGEFIKDEIEARKLNKNDFAKQLLLSPAELNQLLSGNSNITPELAIKLENTLGIKAEFWIRLQVHYEIETIRIKYRNMLNTNNINASKRKSIQRAIISY